MKKGEVTMGRFDKVEGHHLTNIATKVGCQYSYVYMIIHGQRPANTNKAKKVIAAATILQEALVLADKKTEKALVELDND